MKLAILFLTTLSLSLFAAPVQLPGEDYSLTDVAELGLKKEALFRQMDRDLIKLGGSICANRAHMWSFDFKRFYNVDSGKLFLFYTPKTGRRERNSWWYHVTPVVSENNTIYAMDAGFSFIKGPLTVAQWLEKFTKSTNCREIKNEDTELIERMFSGATFPATTSLGTYDCYYRLVPAGYWFPGSVARHLLGRDSRGRPVRHERPEILASEVRSACREAVTSGLGLILGGGKKKCENYMNATQP